LSPGANHKLAVFTHRGPVSIGMRENSLFLLLAIIIGMFSGLAAVLSVFQFTKVAFTWYFMIGAIITFLVGWLASRIAKS